MSDLVYIDKIDEIHLRIRTDRGILREMQDHFSFFADNYKFHPKFKAKAWDGKIKLLDARSGKIYVGLLDEILRFCEERGYEAKYDYSELADDEMSLAEARAFLEGLRTKVKIPDFELRDYQIESVAHCIRKRRALFLSPTSSGKSWMIYAVIKYYLLRYKLPALIIVDSTAAVSQMRDDFIEYGEDENNIHGILGGVDKSVITPITISTWQSLLKTPKEWFDRYGTVIGDEAHHFAAKTFQALMEKITEAPYRFGFTGTIKGSKCLVGSTAVHTTEGVKALRDVREGDKVLSYNEDDGELEFATVLQQINNAKPEKLLKVTTEDGKSITCTPDHRILTERGYVEAAQLSENDVIITI